MCYTQKIKSLIKTVDKSETFHAVVIQGPAGYGKTTAVSEAFNELGLVPKQLGNYSTPLNLFNFFYENNNQWILIDDAAGIFENALSMSILKGATWPQHNGKRSLSWGSTSAKALVESFHFSGKVAIICNSFPKTSDALAVLSRSAPLKIALSAEQAKVILREGVSNKKYFEDADLALNVADFLCFYLTDQNVNSISFRTLRLGYEFATHNPDSWEPLLLESLRHSGLQVDGETAKGISSSEEPTLIKELMNRLNSEFESVKDQEREFERITGLKRRSFYQYRKQHQISRAYQKRS